MVCLGVCVWCVLECVKCVWCVLECVKCVCVCGVFWSVLSVGVCLVCFGSVLSAVWCRCVLELV